MTDTLIATLRRLVGPTQVLTAADEDLAGWELDWRKRYRGRALPWCARARRPRWPR